MASAMERLRMVAKVGAAAKPVAKPAVAEPAPAAASALSGPEAELAELAGYLSDGDMSGQGEAKEGGASPSSRPDLDRMFAGLAAPSQESVEAQTQAAEVAEEPVVVKTKSNAPGSPMARLAQMAAQTAREDQAAADFRKDMASLRSLGRLMAAVYVRPGSDAPVVERVMALKRLAQVSRETSAGLLEAMGQSPENPYFQAMAMSAVVEIIGKVWEEQAGDPDEPEFLSDQPLEVVRSACADEGIMQVAAEMSKRTWDSVSNERQYSDVIAMAGHRAYWRIYILGQYVDGLDAKRCANIAKDLLQYLADYPQPRGVGAEMRANWLSASMGRLADLVCAELRAKYGLDRAPTDDELRECLSVAMRGFEGIEEHASKLLESTEALVDRAVDRPAG